MGGKSELQIEIVSKKLLGKLLNGNLNTAYTEHNADPVYGEEKSTSDTVPDIPAKNVNRDMGEALMQSNKKPSVVSIVKEAMAEFKIEKKDPFAMSEGEKKRYGDFYSNRPKTVGETQAAETMREGPPDPITGATKVDPVEVKRIADLKVGDEETLKQRIGDPGGARGRPIREAYRRGDYGKRADVSGGGYGFDAANLKITSRGVSPGQRSVQRTLPWERTKAGQLITESSEGPKETIPSNLGATPSPGLGGKYGIRGGKTSSVGDTSSSGDTVRSIAQVTGDKSSGKSKVGEKPSAKPKATSWWDRAGKDSGPEFAEERFDVGASDVERGIRAYDSSMDKKRTGDWEPFMTPTDRRTGTKPPTDDGGDDGTGGTGRTGWTPVTYPGTVNPDTGEIMENKKEVPTWFYDKYSEEFKARPDRDGLTWKPPEWTGGPGQGTKGMWVSKPESPADPKAIGASGPAASRKRPEGRFEYNIPNPRYDSSDPDSEEPEMLTNRIAFPAYMSGAYNELLRTLNAKDIKTFLDAYSSIRNPEEEIVNNITKSVMMTLQKAKTSKDTVGRLPRPRSEEPVEIPDYGYNKEEDWQPDYEAQYGSGRGSYTRTETPAMTIDGIDYPESYRYEGEPAPFGSGGGKGSGGQGGYWSRLQPGGRTVGKGLQKQVPPAMTTAPKKPPMATAATGPANVGGVNTGIPIKMSKGSKNKERQVPARKRPRPTSPKQIEAMAKSALLKMERYG